MKQIFIALLLTTGTLAHAQSAKKYATLCASAEKNLAIQVVVPAKRDQADRGDWYALIRRAGKTERVDVTKFYIKNVFAGFDFYREGLFLRFVKGSQQSRAVLTRIHPVSGNENGAGLTLSCRTPVTVE